MRAERFEATATGLRIATRSLAILARRQRDLAEELLAEELDGEGRLINRPLSETTRAAAASRSRNRIHGCYAIDDDNRTLWITRAGAGHQRTQTHADVDAKAAPWPTIQVRGLRTGWCPLTSLHRFCDVTGFLEGRRSRAYWQCA